MREVKGVYICPIVSSGRELAVNRSEHWMTHQQLLMQSWLMHVLKAIHQCALC